MQLMTPAARIRQSDTWRDRVKREVYAALRRDWGLRTTSLHVVVVDDEDDDRSNPRTVVQCSTDVKCLGMVAMPIFDPCWIEGS